ncbi:peptidase M28 [Nitrosopumilus sp. b3]|uniref:DUF4910 domain-containing protein n=1 Tax=Nitrosopumilus sp. b3 TaxID=2109909 RepID=UPI0015F4E02B|nr:DUF4910 domain-containing protein [Nitrosopumilus sp. b3]KAF6246729.1 peptidase M28 [Nitrosopumilus sp. b3]
METINEFSIDEIEITKNVEKLFKELFPICRSITGNGVRKSLKILNHVTEFTVKEIPSKTQCYDWIIPDEWNITDAYIEDEEGKRIIDFQKNNLHVMNYSIPIDKWMSYEELKKHLHTLQNLPDAIPYRTTYYKRDWGFCLAFNDFCKLDKQKKYHAVINSSLELGSLTYGEYNIMGNSGKEFIFSSYCCHPSLANDNMSGMILWIILLKILKSLKLKHSYRFALVPETIGAIAYLAKNEEMMSKVDGGFVLTCVGGPSKFSYKETFLENCFIDKIVDESFKESNVDYIRYPFDINGSDESHFSAPYFRIPIGTICKDKYYEFDYYHTSLDNLNFIKSKSIVDTLKIYLKIISKLEKIEIIKNKDNFKIKKAKNKTLTSLNPFCEPMLSKRNLYPSTGGQIAQKAVNFSKNHHSREYEVDENNRHSGLMIDALSWLMFYADGINTIEDISKRSGLKKELLYKATKILVDHKLVLINE